MAILNPRKKFNFRVTILAKPDIAAFSVQQITLGESAIEVVEHGFGNTVIKTAGMIKPGNITMDQIMSADSPAMSSAMWAWHWLVQNPSTQIGGDPFEYKRTIKVEELGNGLGAPTALNIWYAIGAWPATMNGREFDRMSSDNLVQSIEFSVDYLTQDLPQESILLYS